jgi:AmmeMemoRadiSam system protein A
MKELLRLARITLEKAFKSEEFLIPENILRNYSMIQGCFVTLTKNGELRGCMGTLMPKKFLYKDVIDNTLNAAFHDARFQPLKQEELSAIKIEISILLKPEKLDYDSEQDLLNQLNPRMGVILKKGAISSTFLPYIWEEISNKRSFMEYLSVKAGLRKDAWKTSQIWIYKTESVRED